MRSVERDQRLVFIARFSAPEPVLDSQGRYTGRNEPRRSDPRAFRATASAVRGEARNDVFGQKIDYDRTLAVDDPAFEAREADVLWVERPTDRPHDYVVKRVARSANYTLLAAKQVEVGP